MLWELLCALKKILKEEGVILMDNLIFFACVIWE
jgi:hypothetical protein